VFTARYALSPYIKQIGFVFKGLKLPNTRRIAQRWQRVRPCVGPRLIGQAQNKTPYRPGPMWLVIIRANNIESARRRSVPEEQKHRLDLILRYLYPICFTSSSNFFQFFISDEFIYSTVLALNKDLKLIRLLIKYRSYVLEYEEPNMQISSPVYFLLPCGCNQIRTVAIRGSKIICNPRAHAAVYVSSKSMECPQPTNMIYSSSNIKHNQDSGWYTYQSQP
jgi:hypothetical protein